MNSVILAVLGAALAAPAALAQTDPSADLINLNYYPHRGRFYGATQYEMPFYDKAQGQSNGIATSSTATSYEELVLTFVYGLPIEGLRAGASETWLIHRHNDVTNLRNSAVSPEDAAGLSDPTFTAAYRVFSDAPSSGLSLDFGMNGSPSLVSHRVTNTVEEGNDGKGYGTLALNGALFWAGGWIEAELYGEVTRLFSGNSVQDSGDLVNQTSTRASTWNAVFEILERVHFCGRWYAQAEGDFYVPYSYASVNTPTPTVTHSVSTPFYVVPHLLVGFSPAQWIAVDTSVSYTSYATDTSQLTSPDTLSSTTDVVWSLRARFAL